MDAVETPACASVWISKWAINVKKLQSKKLDSPELKPLKSAILVTRHLAPKGFYSLFPLIKDSAESV